MLDTLKIYNELKETLEPQAALKVAEALGYVYGELQNTVTKTEFNELKEAVKELAEAQQRTEKRVGELAEAQKHTEHRLEELAEAQKRTEHRLEELAEAQKRTEHELQLLTREVRHIAGDLKETRRQLGGLAMTVGYTLENEAYKALPELLKQDFNLVIKGRLNRDFIRDNKGADIEVNILGKGKQNGKEFLIVGESKSQLSENDINTFLRKKLKRLQGIHENLFPVLISHMVSGPAVKKYAKEKGIALYLSSQF